MSTQTSAWPSLPFSITHPQQNLRLLELPPDLHDLLTSDTRPGTLELKSASSTSINPTSKGSKSKGEYLHLCTNDKVWAIRQVSTSNSVYIAQPASSNNPDTINDSNTAATTTLTAISQPTSTLELLTMPPLSTKTEIRSLLPIYPLPNLDTNQEPPTSPHSPESVLTSIPLPTPLLKRTMRELFVISLPNPKDRNLPWQAFIPSPPLLLQSLKLFIEQLDTSDPMDEDDDDDDDNKDQLTDLSTLDLLGAGDPKTSLAQEEGEIYAVVVDAILERFVELEDMEEGDDEEEIREQYSSEGKLKGKETTAWLGNLIVRCSYEDDNPNGLLKGKAKRDKGALTENELLEQWKGLLPKSWWQYCTIDHLLEAGECIIVDGRVRLIEQGQERKSTSTSETGGVASSTGTSTPSSAATASGKRNWHEKFAKEREKK